MRKQPAMDSQQPFSMIRQLKVGDGKGTGGVTIQQVCNDALSTKDGTVQQWGELISTADATKFVKGNLECVKSAGGFDFWDLLAPSISKRDGSRAVANASTGKTRELETQLSGPANPRVDFRTNLNNHLYQHEQRGLGRDG